MEINDVLIIGAGPAGLSAAIYASRSNLDTVILEAGAPGGKLLKTSDIDNYIGMPKANGFELASKMYEHALSFGAKHEYGNVIEVADAGEYKIVKTDDGVGRHAKVVIIATGTNEQLLNVPGEEEYTGRGVSYCAVCDAAFFRDKEVAVIGGGNSAVEEAIYLTRFASKVHIIIRRDVFRAEPIVEKEALENEKIEIHRLRKPKEILGDGAKVTGIVLTDSNTGEEETITLDGVFPFIGALPVTSFAKGLDILDERGYITVNEKMETKVPGVYAAGDVCAKTLRQVATAVGDGAIAGQQAYHYIKK